MKRQGDSDNQKRIRVRNKAHWIGHLGGRCVDCGISDQRVLTFDHVDPSSKEWTITQLMTRADPLDPDLVREVAKCVLRCFNCHFIKSVESGEIGRPSAEDVDGCRDATEQLLLEIFR